MKIYFNWLGEWTELDNDNDFINGMSPSSFVDSLQNITSDIEMMSYVETIKITKQDINYYVPANLLVWRENKKEDSKSFAKPQAINRLF